MEQVVEKLLLEYDCVIIPGFGGFVLQGSNAKINFEAGIIMPPSKHVAFNVNLTQNDGLLVNKLVKINRVSFEKAHKEIENFVLQIQADIRKNKKYNFGNIGTFLLNNDLIHFIPTDKINFNTACYGLPSVLLPEAKPNVREKQFSIPVKEIKVKNKTHAGKLKKWVPVLLALPVAASILFYTFRGSNNLNPFQNVSGFFINDAPETLYSKRIQPDLPVIPELQIKPNQSTFHTAEPENAMPKTQELPTPKTENKMSNVSYGYENKWMLIAGCFQYEENALSLIQELNAKGFNASLAGKAPNGLIRVSAATALSREELSAYYQKALSENYSVWFFQSN